MLRTLQWEEGNRAVESNNYDNGDTGISLQGGKSMSLRIPKERKEVIIYTRNHRIEGEIYLLMDSRISDELNVRVREFIPVTNCKVYTLNGDSLLYAADFVTVNKHSIDLVLSMPIQKEY
jgi:hypothetical protein